MEKAENTMQQSCVEATNYTRTAPSTTSDKQSAALQLPTICYPPTNTLATPPMFDSSQFRSRAPFNLPSLQYRTATFTQLQVAQTTFRYPPTPPIDITDNSTAMQQVQALQSCDVAPTLSHLSYPANGDGVTGDKNSFSSLPTPPDLVPISTVDVDGTSSSNCSMSPSAAATVCNKNNPYYYPPTWQQQSTDQQMAVADITSNQCHTSQALPVQAWSESNTSPLSIVQQHQSASTTGSAPMSHFFFQLPPQYGDGESLFYCKVCVFVLKTRCCVGFQRITCCVKL